jgi:hypothetical protein
MSQIPTQSNPVETTSDTIANNSATHSVSDATTNETESVPLQITLTEEELQAGIHSYGLIP